MEREQQIPSCIGETKNLTGTEREAAAKASVAGHETEHQQLASRMSRPSTREEGKT
jgi:hypothetical protein